MPWQMSAFFGWLGANPIESDGFNPVRIDGLNCKNLCRTVALSNHIVCNVHTNDCFFDTSRQRVDGVDMSILSAQLFFGLKGNWEHQLSRKYALGG